MPATTSYRAFLVLVQVANLLRRSGDRFFREYGLTQSQFNVLMIARLNPDGLSQTEIAQELVVKAANTTVLLKRLEERGLVNRRPDPNDDRTKLVRISAKGKRLVEKVEAPYRDEVERLMQPLGKRELERFATCLETLRVTASELDERLS